MTAQIISLADYRNRRSAAADPAAAPAVPASAAAALLPVAVRIADAADQSTIVSATAALSAACRDMAMNLAMLMTHAEAACHSIGDIGDTAEALVKTGADLRQVADGFRQDHDRMSSELAAAGLPNDTP
jgi:hypothetical protein